MCVRCWPAASWGRGTRGSAIGRRAGRAAARRAGGAGLRVYARPLSADWREALGRGPKRVIGGGPPAEYGEDATWAETEYGRSGTGDARAPARLVAMADRCRSQPVVLAVQDTTMVNDSGLEGTKGLVGPGGGGKGSRGIAAHAGVASVEGGCALGVLHLDAGLREEDRENAVGGAESGRWTDAFASSAGLAAACPRTRVVNLRDREGDMWELLSKGCGSAGTDGGAGLLVRASRSNRRRALTEDGGAEDLFTHTEGLVAVAGKTIDIEACGGPRGRKARKGVRLEVRAGFVDLVPPTDLPKGTPPLRMLAVRVTEPRPPKGKERLDWLLTATEGGPDAANALRVAGWYGRRWLIGEWFSALKTGTRIRDRRPSAADDLRRCLAFDAVTACTVMSGGRLARSGPDRPARTVVHPDGIHVLAVHMAKPNHRRQRGPPDPARTVREFAASTARLAGSVPSRRQPTPGTRKPLEGYLILSLFTENYRAMRDYADIESTVLH